MTAFDADDYRRQSRKGWGAVAGAWGRHAPAQLRAAMPVTAWMLDAARLQPGARVLELAAGPGDVGFMAHELIQPGGELICSDFAPEMLHQAQQRAEATGLSGIRFKQIDAESIDLPAASQDAVLCRWGFMLMADPEAAMRECRRVLRPGGRLVLAAWTAAEENPWSSVVARELVARGLMEPAAGAPGQFAFADRDRIVALLEAAGFVDEIEVEPIGFSFADEDFERWWARTLEMSRSGAIIAALPDAERASVRDALHEALRRYERSDGVLELPARSWVAAATA